MVDVCKWKSGSFISFIRPRPLAFNLSPPSPPLSHFSCGQRTSSAKVGCSSVLSPPSPQQDPSRPHYKNGHMYGSKEMDTDLWIQMNRYRVGMLDIALYLLTILQHAHTAHIYHTHSIHNTRTATTHCNTRTTTHTSTLHIPVPPKMLLLQFNQSQDGVTIMCGLHVCTEAPFNIATPLFAARD